MFPDGTEDAHLATSCGKGCGVLVCGVKPRHDWQGLLLGPGGLGQRSEGNYRFNNCLRKANEDRNPPRLQKLEVFSPIFLDIGHHEIGSKLQDCFDVGIFVPPIWTFVRT